jgi:anti-sigma regulatory factor (Ser/Thr protein kinase)
MDNTFSTYKIDDRSLVPFIKREIHNLAIESGFGTHRAAETDIIISELTSNLIKHANHGEILYRASLEDGQNTIEIFCLDDGIGIDNVGKVMTDGISTANTLGQGLGAIKRLSNQFNIYSLRGWGTVQHLRINETSTPFSHIPNSNIIFHALQVNCPGERVCGDGYFIKFSRTGFQLFVGDGLGHGVHAHDAVQMAIKAFKVSRETDPVEIIRNLHNEVKKTRGLVATIAAVDYKTGTWTICGVGNISTRISYGLESKTYTPYNGIIGHNIPRTLNSTTIPYRKHQIVVMHSDGLNTRWSLNDFPSILKQEPALVAGTLYKGHVRGNDDATVFVGKIL